MKSGRTGPDPDSTGSSPARSGPDSGRDQQLRAARVLEGRVWSTVMPMRLAHAALLDGFNVPLCLSIAWEKTIKMRIAAKR
jgi:hypothetical protein